MTTAISNKITTRDINTMPTVDIDDDNDVSRLCVGDDVGDMEGAVED